MKAADRKLAALIDKMAAGIAPDGATTLGKLESLAKHIDILTYERDATILSLKWYRETSEHRRERLDELEATQKREAFDQQKMDRVEAALVRVSNERDAALRELRIVRQRVGSASLLVQEIGRLGGRLRDLEQCLTASAESEIPSLNLSGKPLACQRCGASLHVKSSGGETTEDNIRAAADNHRPECPGAAHRGSR